MAHGALGSRTPPHPAALPVLLQVNVDQMPPSDGSEATETLSSAHRHGREGGRACGPRGPSHPAGDRHTLTLQTRGGPGRSQGLQGARVPIRRPEVGPGSMGGGGGGDRTQEVRDDSGGARGSWSRVGPTRRGVGALNPGRGAHALPCS